jgi:hypothetical protein
MNLALVGNFADPNRFSKLDSSEHPTTVQKNLASSTSAFFRLFEVLTLKLNFLYASSLNWHK